jgi:adenylate cyclase
VTRVGSQIHNRTMQLSATLSWLVDAASETAGADRLLSELGAHLVEDGLPLAGGSLSLAVPHPVWSKNWNGGRICRS